jgi:hypothetical protein
LANNQNALIQSAGNIGCSFFAGKDFFKQQGVLGNHKWHAAVNLDDKPLAVHASGSLLEDFGFSFDFSAQFFAIHNAVTVSLFGKEQLAVVREILFPCVAGNQREEVCRFARGLGPQYPAEALGLFLT